ncbi:hypothetical protein BIWAKO_00268 [Bosea sp. BIWAKO-01]|nr:hypothetical protein BIWAKO_00268 [Bosea sp. BIWAKO-01]
MLHRRFGLPQGPAKAMRQPRSSGCCGISRPSPLSRAP